MIDTLPYTDDYKKHVQALKHKAALVGLQNSSEALALYERALVLMPDDADCVAAIKALKESTYPTLNKGVAL